MFKRAQRLRWPASRSLPRRIAKASEGIIPISIKIRESKSLQRRNLVERVGARSCASDQDQPGCDTKIMQY